MIIDDSRERLAKGQSHIFDKAPAHPGSKFTTVDADPNDVPGAEGAVILAWLESLK